MKQDKIKIFYRPEMAFVGKDKNSYSNSPRKPKLFVERLKKREDFKERFEIVGDWKPYEKMDFAKAHYAHYVVDFFDGKDLKCESNNISWSPDFAETVRYTNASLFQSIQHSFLNPDTICCSPTSGFHHARPSSGSGFCTFSGQVIASVKMYEKYDAVGCYFDLDGHFGNSIEDTRKDGFFGDIVNKCIPKWANINPAGKSSKYISNLQDSLEVFKRKAIAGEVDYVVWCHGADSHKDDNLGDQVSTTQWLVCTELFVDMIRQIEEEIGRPFPVSYALFGGYRKKYEEVLDLHEQDTDILLSL